MNVSVCVSVYMFMGMHIYVCFYVGICMYVGVSCMKIFVCKHAFFLFVHLYAR